MAIARRIFLFLIVNFLVVLTISFLLRLFHIDTYLTAEGLDYMSLMVFCFIFGMGGAFVSLALSRMMAKWMLGVKVVDPNTLDPQAQSLLKVVYQLAQTAGLSTMPQVGIYNSSEVNAFATGPTQSRSLIAVSSGLLTRMQPKEIEGVLAHEMAHIMNGDMVTMTLLQGIINAFVMFLARALAFVVSGLGKQNQERSSRGSYVSYTLFVFLFETVFMILGSLVIAAYSRFREFRADRGGADLAGRDKMVAALEALKKTLNIQDPKAEEQPALAAMKISSGGRKKDLLSLFASHPSLDLRIRKLKEER